MLLIRNQQIEALAADAIHRFETRIVERLRESHHLRCRELGESGIHVLVSRAVEKARHYGIDGEGDVGDLVRWMLTISPDFDRDVAWVRPILQHQKLSGRAKMGILRERLG